MRKYIFLVLILGSWILTSTSYAAICPTPTNPNAVCADTTTNTTQGVNMTINADGSYTPINSTAQSSTPTAG